MNITYRKISPNSLPYNDKEFLRQTYGHHILDTDNAHSSLRTIEEVRTLNKYEKSLFDEEQLVSPDYCLQFLYKFSKDIERQDLKANLRRNWEKLINRIPELRVNFVPLGYEHKMHKLIFSRCHPEIRHVSLNRLAGNSLDRSIASLMQDDRQKGFDLAQDLLLRLTCVRTYEYEYALILTYPRLISRVFKRVYLDLVLNAPDIPDTLKLGAVDETFAEAPVSPKMKSYWRGIMNNLPSRPKLPGFDPDATHFKQGNYTLSIANDDLTLLKARASDNRGIMVAMLQTAWGLLQKQVNYCRETYFCLIMNEHTLLVEEDARNAIADRSGELTPLPVRLNCEDYMPLREIMEHQLRQMLVSYKLPCRNMRRFLEDIGQPRDLFPYFIYFNGFAVGKSSYSRTPGADRCALVDNIGWDARPVNLSVHFDLDAAGLRVHFRYNHYSFSGYTVEPLAKNYALCLHNMIRAWDERYDVFSKKLSAEIGGWDNTFGGYVL